MEPEKLRILPMGYKLPYTYNDLSVVIPQVSTQQNRLAWFLKNYVLATPKEVIDNTYIIYDQGDENSLQEINKYGIKAVPFNHSYSTLKWQYGFNELVKTRLVVRMANDAYTIRNDWVETLINKFNEYLDRPLFIGEAHPSGDLNEEVLNRLVETYPYFKEVVDRAFYSITKEGVKHTSIQYYHGFFMAGQTYIFKSLYSELVKFNKDKMDKEDILTGIIMSMNNITVMQWVNLGVFVKCIGRIGDFKGEEFNLDKQIIMSPEEWKLLPQAQWKELIYG